MKQYTSLFVFALLPFLGFSQARLVLNNDPYVVLNGGTSTTPVYLVLDNSATNAITMATAQVTGGIKSESEFNQVKWNVGLGTGNYSIPFTKAFGGPILPFSSNITVPGIALGNVKFSTYPGGTWDNNTYKPSDVTNMASAVGGPNYSPKVIDRFWIADANGYTTQPSATFSFTYIDAEWSAAGNTITEANLGAQRFNAPAGNWDTYLPQGTVNTAANTVTNVPVSSANFFRSWTLTDNTSPLPIELLSFTGNCGGKNVVLKWSTATETNNDFFTIERSNDGSSFTQVGIVNGAGTSTSVLNYSFTDYNSLNAMAYYRLKQTDYNGDYKYFNPIGVSSCNNDDLSINAYNNQEGNVVVNVNTDANDNYTATLFDALGKKVIAKQFTSEKGLNVIKLDISSINAGIYFVSVDNGKNIKTQKILIN